MSAADKQVGHSSNRTRPRADPLLEGRGPEADLHAVPRLVQGQRERWAGKPEG